MKKQQTSNEVLWVKLLPDQLKGGSQSRYQKKIKEAAIQKAAIPSSLSSSPSLPMGMSEGGSPHTAKFQGLAEKLKKKGYGKSAFPIAMHALGYEGSIKAGHRQKEGYEDGGSVLGNPGGYTGDEGIAVLADKVNDTKTFVDHQGEYYVNAPMVNILGGPDAVEKLITDTAKNRIAGQGSGQPQIRPQLPILSQNDQGNGSAPISNIRTSFDLGGPTTYDPQGAPAGTISVLKDSTGKFYDPEGGMAPIGSQSVLVKPEEMKAYNDTLNAKNSALARSMAPIDNTAGRTAALARSMAPIATDAKTAALERSMGIGSGAAPYDPKTAALGRSMGVETAGTDQDAARNAALARSMAPIDTSSTDQGRLDALRRSNAGMSEQAVKSPILYPKKPTPPLVAGQADINTGTQFLRDLVSGKNPLMESMINQALRKYGADTASGKAELQMRLNAEGVTGPAADAAMETYDRNARLGRSSIQTSLTTQGMEQAQTAAGQLLGAGQSERSYATAQLQDALTQDLATGNFEQYKKDYQALHGVIPDIATFQTNFATAKIQTATKDLDTAMLKTGQATTLDTPGVRDALGRLYTANGGTGTPTDAQLLPLLENAKHEQDPVWQMKNSWSDDAISSTFFGGDSAALSNFEYNGKTGKDAFQEYVPTLFQGGITITKDPATGASMLTYNWNDPVMKQFINKTGPTNVFDSLPADYKDIGDGYVSKGNEIFKYTQSGDGKFHISMTAETPTTDASGNVSFRGKPLMVDGVQVTSKTVDGETKYYTGDKEVIPDFTNLDESGEPKIEETPPASDAWTTPALAEAGALQSNDPNDYPNYINGYGKLTYENLDTVKKFATLGNADALKDAAQLIADHTGSPMPTDPKNYQKLIDSTDNSKMVVYANKIKSNPSLLAETLISTDPSDNFYQGIANSLPGFSGDIGHVQAIMTIDAGVKGQQLIGTVILNKDGKQVAFKTPDGSIYLYSLIGGEHWKKLN